METNIGAIAGAGILGVIGFAVGMAATPAGAAIGGATGVGLGAIIGPWIMDLFNRPESVVPAISNPLPRHMPAPSPDNELATHHNLSLTSANPSNPAQTRAINTQLITPNPDAYQHLQQISTIANSRLPANLGAHLLTRLREIRQMSSSAARATEEIRFEQDFRLVLQDWSNLQRYDHLVQTWNERHRANIESFITTSHNAFGADMPNMQLPHFPLYTNIEVGLNDKIMEHGLRYFRQTSHNNNATMDDFNAAYRSVGRETRGTGEQILFIYEQMNNEINALRPNSPSGQRINFTRMQHSYSGRSGVNMFLSNPAGIALASWIANEAASNLTGVTAPVRSVDDAIMALRDLMQRGNIETNTQWLERALTVTRWGQNHLGQTGLDAIRREELEKIERYLGAVKARRQLEAAMEDYINHIRETSDRAREEMPRTRTQVEECRTQLLALSARHGQTSASAQTQLLNNGIEIESITPPDHRTADVGNSTALMEYNYTITLIDKNNNNQRMTLVVSRSDEPDHINDVYVTHMMNGTLNENCPNGWAAARDNLQLRLPIRLTNMLTEGGALNMPEENAALVAQQLRSAIRCKAALEQVNQSLLTANLSIKSYGEVTHNGQNYHYITYNDTANNGRRYTILLQPEGDMLKVTHSFQGELPLGSRTGFGNHICEANHVAGNIQIPIHSWIPAINLHGSPDIFAEVINDLRTRIRAASGVALMESTNDPGQPLASMSNPEPSLSAFPTIPEFALRGAAMAGLLGMRQLPVAEVANDTLASPITPISPAILQMAA